MTVPAWMNAVIADFGHAAGVEGLSLGAKGAAVLKFANGVSLKLEYTGEVLVVAVAFRVLHSPASIRRLLAIANPQAMRRPRLRSGIIPKTGEAVAMVVLPEREVTLPLLSAAFNALWRAAEETGGAS